MSHIITLYISTLATEEAEAARVAALKKRSQSVQRDLPRPHTVNKSVLRPSDVSCTELQRAEEMIKREMIVMLHYDALHSPLSTGKKSSQDNAHADYLVTHPYRDYSEEQMDDAKSLLQKEMKVNLSFSETPVCIASEDST